MNTYGRKILTVTFLASLTTLASAQVLSGAAQGAAATRIPVVPPAPTPPAARANAAAQAATGAALRAPAPAAPAVTHAAAGSAVSGSTTTGLNANATTHASAQGQAHGLSVAADASRSLAVTVDPSGTINEIQRTGFAQRQQLTADVQAKLDASTAAVDQLEDKARASGEKSRAAFAQQLREIRAREKALRTSLREANRATQEKTWGEIQSELAHNYGAYAEVVARADTSVNPEPAPTTPTPHAEPTSPTEPAPAPTPAP